MKRNWAWLGMAALIVGSLAGCGGGGGDGGGGGGTPPPGGATDLQGAISAAAADPANDSATNPSAAFTVIQNAGQPVVTVASPPVVRFTVFSDGAVVQGLTKSNVRFNLAKLVRGTNGDPDDWMNYVYSKETPTAGVGPGGTPVLPEAWQATTDPSGSATLVYKSDGYYEYTYSTDILNAEDPRNPGVKIWDPTATHRIGIQLSYTNAAGDTVMVNPYIDFTFTSNGGVYSSVAVTDPAQTRKVVDVSSCNQCHNRLALHGGGRIDPQYCVMCHNNGTEDANSGHNLRLKTMVHKIHAGKREFAQGEEYIIWGYHDSEHDYAEVGFPQDLRNCTKCHDNVKAPQADNWKQKPSKQACLTCHQSGPGTASVPPDATAKHPGTWYNIHVTALGLGSTVDAVPNVVCVDCHGPGKTWRPDQVHFNQLESKKYKVNIEGATLVAAPGAGTPGTVRVQYYISDPTNGDAAYDLFAGCAGTPPVCGSNDKFGNVRFILAYQSLPNQPNVVTEFSSYNNGGNNAAAYAARAGVTSLGNNHYTVDITVPADTATHTARGTARVVSYGQIKEPKLDPVTRLEETPTTLVNVAAQNTFKDVVLTGNLNPRRAVVSTEKCNACHGLLGTASGSNTLENAFHGGARNIVEACVVCHDPNRISSTVMADGSGAQESYQMKRMIHGLHGGTKRTYPFTHGNTVVAAFGKDCVSLADPLVTCSAGTENFTAEVAYPGIIQDCNACHVNDSWKVDHGVLGAGIGNGTDTVRGTLDDLVISPKAATCTGCHDATGVKTHVVNMGGATFGTLTQGDLLNGAVFEVCQGCHEARVGALRPVDQVHGLK
jgi:OmcA/MtrC family decaheme c-type cytochrome